MTTGRCARIHVLLAVVLLNIFFMATVSAKEKNIDICSLVSAEQLAGIYRKPLFPTALRSGCFWSEEPGAMAYLQISYSKKEKELREHFHQELPEHVKLIAINDLGNNGLMGVTNGRLELILIQKKEMVLKSNVTFLDIEQGSNEQEKLWEIYRTILKEM
jgi:hypothetical protein